MNWLKIITELNITRNVTTICVITFYVLYLLHKSK